MASVAFTGSEVSLSRAGKAGILIALCALTLFWFFRQHFLSGFDLYGGTRADSSIEIGILEHWYGVWRGLRPWEDAPWFYPHHGALGYQDAHFGYGLIYSVLRAAALDRFQASEYTHLLLKIAGFFGFYYVAARIFRLPFAWSAFGAVLFSTLNGYFIHSPVHAQLYTMNLVPWAFALGYHGVDAFSQGRRWAFFGYGLGLVLLYGAWLLSTFYLAWFFGFFAFFALVALVWQIGRAERRRLVGLLRRHAWLVLLLAVCFAAELYPFLHLYLPAIAATGGFGPHEIEFHAGHLIDVFNVGPHNIVYQILSSRPSFEFSERSTGLTPFLALCFVIAAVMLARDRTLPQRTLLIGLLIVTVATWLLTIKFGHFLAWRFVYAYVPGAGAIRAVPRYVLLLSFFIILFVLISLSRLPRRVPFPLVLFAGALLLVEQTNLDQMWAMSRTEENAALGPIGPPPAECKSFFVSRPRPQPIPRASEYFDEVYRHNVDAMTIAVKFNLPTINGQASVIPKGWNLIYFSRPDYKDRVLAYANENHIVAGLCSLDIPAARWDTTPFGAQ